MPETKPSSGFSWCNFLLGILIGVVIAIAISLVLYFFVPSIFAPLFPQEKCQACEEMAIEAESEIDETLDTDKDGLTDAEEAKLKTNPYQKDSDGDGYSDKKEVDEGYDPLSTKKTKVSSSTKSSATSSSKKTSSSSSSSSDGQTDYGKLFPGDDYRAFTSEELSLSFAYPADHHITKSSTGRIDTVEVKSNDATYAYLKISDIESADSEKAYLGQTAVAEDTANGVTWYLYEFADGYGFSSNASDPFLAAVLFEADKKYAFEFFGVDEIGETEEYIIKSLEVTAN